MAMVKRIAKRQRNPSLKLMVRNMMESRLEHKRTTAVGVYADLATAGVVNTISMAVAQGDDIGNRAGDLIRPRNLRIRAEFRNSQGVFSSFTARVIIFQDTMCNGSTPAVTDLLSTASPLSGWNPTTKQASRFKVLYDRVVTPVAQTDKELVYVTADITMGGVIHYLGGTAAAGSQGRGSLFALFIADTALANTYQFAWSYDFVYTDA